MKIDSLTLQNFQGVRDLTIDFGPDTEIRGDNATGKTTVANAITWLLTGKSLDGEKGYSPKPKGPDGIDIHNLETSVIADVVMDDGTQVNLKKTVSEKWTKKRGTTTEVYTGNTISYWIYGVPNSESEYNKYLDEHFPPDQTKILMNPLFFSQELDWKERRKLLLDVFGDVTQADVIASNGDLKPLGALLKNGDHVRTVEDFGKIQKEQLKRLNAELDALPDRIDEAEKAIPELTYKTKKAIDEAQKPVAARIAELEEARKARAVDPAAPIRKKKLDLQEKFQSSKIIFDQFKNAEYDRAVSEKRNLEGQLAEAERSARITEANIEDENRMLERMKRKYTEQLKRIATVKARRFDGSEACPTCGQPLPEDMLEESRTRFNRNKSVELERLIEEGKSTCGKDSQAKQQVFIAEMQAELAKNKGLIEEINGRIAEIVIPERANFAESDEAIELQAEIDSLQKQIDSAETAREPSVENSVYYSLQEELRSFDAARANLEVSKAQKKRISELTDRQKDVAGLIEESERALYLCDLYTKAKVSLLDSNINQFKTVRFRLYEDQLNGGLRECCDVMIPGESGLVPYRFANSAAKVNAGIEIINRLSDKFGFTMPLIIDNAESVVKLEETNEQVIRLIVDGSKKTLEVK